MYEEWLKAPPLPDCADLAQRILESPRMGERMKRALIYLMQGEGYRPATRRAGLWGWTRSSACGNASTGLCNEAWREAVFRELIGQVDKAATRAQRTWVGVTYAR